MAEKVSIELEAKTDKAISELEDFYYEVVFLWYEKT